MSAARTSASRATLGLLAVLLGVHPAPARAEHTAPGGLRGLLRTHSADTSGQGVLEFGAFASMHTLDDSTGGTKAYLVAPLQLGYGASRYFELGLALPIRGFTTFGGRDVSGVSQRAGGFGDLEAAAKLQLPIPGRTVRLGIVSGAAFPTGSRSRGFGRERADATLGGALTIDLSWIERFPATRVHFNTAYRWNRTETGFGLGSPNDPRAGGFWPPAAAPVPPGGQDRYNDQILWRGAVEFSTRILGLFTEVTFDDSPRLDGVRTRQHPWMLVQGAVLKFRNGFNLKGAAEVSLQADPPLDRVPRLPDLRFTFGITYRTELTFGDSDHDGVHNDRDQCRDRAEDFDGFQDDDGCPDLDNDNDGIPDKRDLAPDLPEDVDGFEDQDGRPDLDDDGDGFRDSEDECPRQPEDFDGDRDTDGCPDDQSESGPAAPVAPAQPAPGQPAPSPTPTPQEPAPKPRP